MRGYPWNQAFSLDALYSLRALFLEMQNWDPNVALARGYELSSRSCMSRFPWRSFSNSSGRRPDVRYLVGPSLAVITCFFLSSSVGWAETLLQEFIFSLVEEILNSDPSFKSVLRVRQRTLFSPA